MSSIPGVIDALIARLRARPALQAPDVLISDGFPGPGLAGKRLVTVGGKAAPTADGAQTSAELGNMRRQEDYVLNVSCSAVTGGDDQKLSRDQAFDLMYEVEGLLRTDPTLGGAVNQWCAVEGGIVLLQTDPDTAASGRWADISFDVRVRNRL